MGVVAALLGAKIEILLMVFFYIAAAVCIYYILVQSNTCTISK